MSIGLTVLGIAVAIIVLFFLSGLRVVRQYQKGVKFTLGRYVGTMNPGLHLLVPIFQSMERVDMRQRVINLPEQEVQTKDQVNLTIDGVVFYSITSARDSVLNVERITNQISAKATSELKQILGERTMKESLSDRDNIAKDLKKQLNLAIEDEDAQKGKETAWGVQIRGVQINNINLPKELIRAMAKVAEATQEAEARVTKAGGELSASKKLYEAAKQYKDPKAMRLRELQTYQEIGTEQNSLMLVIPSGMMGDSEVKALASSIATTEGMRRQKKRKSKGKKRK